MRKTIIAALMGMLVAGSAVNLSAQVAGSTTLGVSVEEVKTIAKGWSAKKQIMGKTVYNDKDERVGEVQDLIVAPDKSISYAIVAVGGFLGLGEHYVAIPVHQFKGIAQKITLPGATKDALKAMPKFEYTS